MADQRKLSHSDDLVDAFKEMTLLELSEFVKQFDETFDVTAAAPVAVAPSVAGGRGDAGAAAPAEKGEFDVILEAVGDKKIQVIKEVRTLTSLGLKEAKDLVDGAPKALLEKVNKETADKAKAALESAGAQTVVVGGRARPSEPGPARRRASITRAALTPEVLLIRQTSAVLGGRESVARAFGRPVDQVASWLTNDSAPPNDLVFTARSVLEVGLVFESVWDASLYPDWLVTDNAHLNYARPIDVIASGRADETVAAIESAAYGTFA